MSANWRILILKKNKIRDKMKGITKITLDRIKAAILIFLRRIILPRNILIGKKTFLVSLFPNLVQ